MTPATRFFVEKLGVLRLLFEEKEKTSIRQNGFANGKLP